MNKVYLCGAINGCTDSGAMDWRERVKTILRYEYVFLDPMRRDYRGREGDFANEIVVGDLADIEASDIVLVAADKPSWGTAMEMFHAHTRGKAVICVCSSECPSPWLQIHSTELVATLDQAIAILQSASGGGAPRSSTSAPTARTGWAS